jgi:hypothetical protein
MDKGDRFWYGFSTEIAKVAAANPGMVSKVVGKVGDVAKRGWAKIKGAGNLAKWGLIGTLGYGLWKAIKGASEAHQELKDEGQL